MMQIKIADFNDAESQIAKKYKSQWDELNEVLQQMPLHLKPSDQEGIQGNPIFDPVGTNEYIKSKLVSLDWQPNVLIPQAYSFLGTNIDFVKSSVMLEVQFSNYPFLLNNLLRSELFFKSEIPLPDPITGLAVGIMFLVAKAHMFPASQSTLYYEQAVKQLIALAEHKVFTIPIRVIGLFENSNEKTKAVWSHYHTARYSRTVVNRKIVDCQVHVYRTGRSGLSIEED